MAFDCAYHGLGIDESARLTRDAIAAAAREHGLTTVYAIARVEVLPHRWRRRIVDVVVHVADGDDILGMQFPDEAHAAVTAAVEAILRARDVVARAGPHAGRTSSSPPGSGDSPRGLAASTAARGMLVDRDSRHRKCTPGE